MEGVENKIDPTSNLPDELLYQVFGYLPLRGKLRLESVSHRFQRIILDLLKRPQPLVLSTETKRLNGYRVRWEQLSDALWSLASKSKFSRIKIRIREQKPGKRNAEQTEQMNSLLSILLVTNCLDKVVSFNCNYGPSQDILEKVFAQCTKLSSVALDFIVRPPNIQLGPLEEDKVFATDLFPVLSTKSLKHLNLRLVGYTQDRLVGLFRSLKPQTLQKLSLMFYDKLNQTPALNMAGMVTELSANAWAELQEMKLGWGEDTSAHIDLATFIQSLPLMPSLNKCLIFFDQRVDAIEPENQFVAAMTSLFKSDIKISVSSPWSPGVLRPDDLGAGHIPDCQAVALIRQVQGIYPNMNIDFKWNGCFAILTLSMGNGRFEELLLSHSCDVADCFECHRFYPAVLQALIDSADEHTDMHLDGFQLDGCRIDTLVDRLNGDPGPWRAWRALTALVNDAGDLVTISFEAANQDRSIVIQYDITVGCGPCFNNSCIRCVNVE